MGETLERSIDRLLEELGYELVVLERGGGKRRPLLRLRVDRPDGVPGRSSLTVEDCARVSRAVTELLESRGDATGDYILEVSSPGVERPLVKPRDYARFAGLDATLRGYRPLKGDRKQVDVTLAGYDEEEDSVLADVDGERISIPLAGIAKASLKYRLEDMIEERA